MTENEKLAYFAGLFDGEGCVHARMATSIQIRLQLGMTHEQTVRSFAETFALPVYLTRHGNKDFFTAVACGRRVGEILKLLQPFLVTKTLQAEVGILLAAEMGPPFGGHPLTAPQHSRRLELAAKLKVLNQ